MYSFSSLLTLAVALPALVAAELSGKVGPTTSHAAKAAIKTCDITKYGAVADGKTDISTALNKAFTACKSGGVVVIPTGNYAMSQWVKLANGNNWALQLDGIITRTGTDGGNMIMIEHGDNFEMFSSTGKGVIQGNGYEFHKQGSISGPRLLRMWDVSNFSVHDIILVDSPSFHFSIDTCSNGEVYNMAIRGGNQGGLDGIDVWSNNIWVHDVMVTNKDECVTVKSPSKNILVENIYCNWSGGCGMGSFGADTAVSHITYRNIYTWSSNQMFMLKSNGGSGTVSNIVLENFIGHENAYSLTLDEAWSSMKTVAGNGVQLSNFQISNWTGTEANGKTRGPIKVACAAKAPCHDISITDFNMWTESGTFQFYSCENAYGSGFCLKSGTSYAAYPVTTQWVSKAPAGYAAPTMPADLKTAFGTTLSIPVPTMPASFFPGVLPITKLAGSS